MTSSELARNDSPRPSSPAPALVPETTLPPRPTVAGKPPAPVLEKKSPPFAVRLSQLFWILSIAVGAVGVVYSFVIRQAQLPDIVGVIRGVDGSRADATYTSAADILYWSVFAGLVVVLLLQITMLVSFSNRRPKVRWWQFGTLVLQGLVVIVAAELIAIGTRGAPLDLILLGQYGLAVLAFLSSLLPWALRWTARQHDIRHAGRAGDADL